MREKFDLQSTILRIIESVIPLNHERELSEQLDSLHRIFIIERIEQEVKLELRDILLSRDAWKTIESLVNTIERKFHT